MGGLAPIRSSDLYLGSTENHDLFESKCWGWGFICVCEIGTGGPIWRLLRFSHLVSHYRAISDIISCDASYSLIGLEGLSLDCDRPFFTERSGGCRNTIVCDTHRTKNWWSTKIASFDSLQNLPFWKPTVLIPFRVPKNHPNGYPNCWCTEIASFNFKTVPRTCDFETHQFWCPCSHRVLQGAAQGGGQFYFIFCGSLGPLIMQQTKPFLPENLNPPWREPPKSWFSGRGWGQHLSVFRVRWFSEWPEPLHWIAFPVEVLTQPLIHWIASPLFTEKPFFSLKCASSHPKNRLLPPEHRLIGCQWTENRVRQVSRDRGVGRTVLKSSRGPYYQRNFSMQGISVNWLYVTWCCDSAFLV